MNVNGGTLIRDGPLENLLGGGGGGVENPPPPPITFLMVRP